MFGSLPVEVACYCHYHPRLGSGGVVGGVRSVVCLQCSPEVVLARTSQFGFGEDHYIWFVAVGYGKEAMYAILCHRIDIP